jgi:BirA family biotin operon repressor/biotin-[acetyl-CoA-carboxylase] ligase
VSEALNLLLGRGFPDARVIDETGSTNDDLKESAKCGAPEWTVLLARRQSAGRGRHGRTWVSLEGNLHVSVVLRPEPPWAGLVPIAGALAVADLLEREGLEPRLKWPNDVLLGGRKVAGVLAEGLSSGGNLEAVILGVGVNLGADPGLLPSRDATSVQSVLGRAPSVLEAAAAILTRLRIWYDSLRRDGPGPVLASFRARSVPWWGKGVEVVSGGERVVGRARDLDARGGLVLEREDGSFMTLLSGEARELGPI